MQPDSRITTVERVKHTDRERLSHLGGYPIGRPPLHSRAFLSRLRLATYDPRTEHQGYHTEPNVLVNAGQSAWLDDQAGFFFDLTPYASRD